MKKPDRPKFGGRKKGTLNKFNSARVEEAKRQAKVLPAEGLLTIFNNLLALAAKYQPTVGNLQGNEAKYFDYLMAAGVIGRSAAPYYSPKLASITIKAANYDLTRLSDAELSEFERLALLAADPGSNPSRGGETLQ